MSFETKTDYRITTKIIAVSAMTVMVFNMFLPWGFAAAEKKEVTVTYIPQAVSSVRSDTTSSNLDWVSESQRETSGSIPLRFPSAADPLLLVHVDKTAESESAISSGSGITILSGEVEPADLADAADSGSELPQQENLSEPGSSSTSSDAESMAEGEGDPEAGGQPSNQAMPSTQQQLTPDEVDTLQDILSGITVAPHIEFSSFASQAPQAMPPSGTLSALNLKVVLSGQNIPGAKISVEYKIASSSWEGIGSLSLETISGEEAELAISLSQNLAKHLGDLGIRLLYSYPEDGVANSPAPLLSVTGLRMEALYELPAEEGLTDSDLLALSDKLAHPEYFETLQFSTKNVSLALPGDLTNPLTIQSSRTKLPLRMLFVGASKQAAALREDRNVRYREAYPQTDIGYEITEKGFKESIILNGAGHPSSFRYYVNLSDFDAAQTAANRIVLYEKGHLNQPFFQRYILSAPFMEDSEGSRSEQITMEVKGNILSLIPDEKFLEEAEYPVIVDPSVEISVLDLYSHPVQGDIWGVDFATVGTDDLSVAPADQFTIQDTQFVSLTCDGSDREPGAGPNGAINFSAWSCDGVGRVEYKVLRTGEHHLVFNFGEAKADAYNSALVWSGAGGDGLWSTAANWLSSEVEPRVPQAGDSVTFDNTCTSCNVTIDAPVSVTSINLASSYTGTITQAAGANLTLTGNYTQAGGTFTGGAASMTVAGSFTQSGGTYTAPASLYAQGSFAHTSGIFQHNNGTVNLTGSGQVISGSSTFYNVSKTISSADTLTFQAGSTQTIAHNLAFQGTGSAMLGLRSSASGSSWNIDIQGSSTLAYLDVRDSNNVGSAAIDVTGTGSVSSGNNTNWTFDINYSQAEFRFYENSDLLQPTVAIGALNSTTTITATDTPVRLRMSVRVENQPLASSTVSFRLQVATDVQGQWMNVGGGTTSGFWYDPSWLYRKQLSFNNGASSDNLNDFPALVTLSPSNFDYSKAKGDGSDLRFTDADGLTILNYEVESWNQNATSTIWVKVPRINASSTTDSIYMYYGNAGASGVATSTGVWNSGFTNVWHLKENTGTFSNSAGANLMYARNAVAYDIDAIGGKGVSVTDGSAYLSSGWEQGLTAFTEEIWFKTTATQGGKIIGFGNYQTGSSGSYDRHTYMENSGRLSFGTWIDTPRIARSTSSYNDGQWHYLVGSIGADGTNLYVDGDLVGFDSNTRADTYGGYWRAGYDNLNYWPNAPTSYHFSGLVDEMRISNVTYTPSWVKAQYDSMRGSFLNFGSEELQNSGEWNFYDNASLSATSALASMLLPSSTGYGLYSETNLSGPNAASASPGDYLEYDWSLDPSSMLSATYYYFRMVTSDGNVFQSYNSYPTIVRATSQLPNQPAGLGPSGLVSGGWSSSTAPTLTFSVTDPDTLDQVRYVLQIDDSSDFASPLVDYTSALGGQGSRSFTVGQDASGGTYATGTAGQVLPESADGYYWRVMAKDGLDNASGYTTANSGQVAFKVDATAPVIGNFSLVPTATSVTVSISDASDASSGFTNIPYRFSNLTTGTSSPYTGFTSWTSGQLSPNTAYSFSAIALDVAGNSITATGSVFTLANPPTSGSASALSFTSVRTSWNSSSNPAGTEYLVENVTTTASSGWITLTTYDFADLACGTTYTFRVKAKNAQGQDSAYSSTFQGATNPCNVAPNVPASLGSATATGGGWMNDNTPTLSFSLSDTNAGQSVKYSVQIDDDADFSSPAVDYTSALSSQGSPSFTVGQATGSGTYAAGSQGQVLPDGSYFWRVKAIDALDLESEFVSANSGEIAFKLDTVAPETGTVVFSTVTPQSILVSVSGASDAGSGLAANPYLFSNITKSANSTATSSTSWLSQGLVRNTSYDFSVTVTDVAGNSATSTTASTTTPEGLATVSSGPVTIISENEATATGTLALIGAYPVLAYGHVWATTTNPYLPDVNMAQEGTGGSPGTNSENRGEVEYAFDGDLDTFWGSDAGFPYEVEYQFPAATVVNKYQIVASPNNANIDSPFSWIFQAWNGFEWVNLQTITAQTGWLNNESRSYLVDNSSAYTKYRLYITANGNGGWTRFAEFKLFNTNSYTSNFGSAAGTLDFVSTLTGLSPLSRYYVRSYAVTQYGVTYGQTREFSAGGVNVMPGAPSSLGPSLYVTNLWVVNSQPVFTFILSDPDTDQLVQYAMQLDDDSDFSSPLIDYTSDFSLQGEQGFTVGQVQGGGSYRQGSAGQILADSAAYYWRVKAIDSSGVESVFVAANSGSIAFKLDTTAPNPGTAGALEKAPTSIIVSAFGESDAFSGIDENNYRYYNLTTGESTGPIGFWWTNTNLLPNRRYDYIVVVTDKVGNTATTATSTMYTFAAVPDSVSVTATTSSEVTVSWSPNGNPAGTEYYVENIGSEAASGWIQTTSYTFTTLTCSNNFSFHVRARNFTEEATGYSEEVSPVNSPCNHAPEEPTNMNYSSGGWVNDNTPRFNFDLQDIDVSDQVRYQIQIDDMEDFSSPSVDYISGLVDQGLNYFQVGQGAGSGAYQGGADALVLPDSYTGYYWRVRAIDSHGGIGSYATANGGGIAFKLDTVPPEPGLLIATDVGTGNVTVSISGARDSESGLRETPYNFYGSAMGHFSGWVSQTSWTDDGLLPGTYYTYYAMVSDLAGNGTSTPVISVATKPGSSGGGGGSPLQQVQPRVLINMGDPFTTTEYVTLQITGQTGTNEMEISSFDNFQGAVREPYQTTKSWNLCLGRATCSSGVFGVNVRFYKDGVAYATANDTINLLKATVPTPTPTPPQTGTSTLPSTEDPTKSTTTLPTLPEDGEDKDSGEQQKPGGQQGQPTTPGGGSQGNSQGGNTTTGGGIGGNPPAGGSGDPGSGIPGDSTTPVSEGTTTPGEGDTGGNPTIIDTITDAISEGGSTIIGKVTDAAQTVAGAVSTVADSVNSIITEVLPNALSPAGEAVRQAAKISADRVTSSAKKTWIAVAENTDSIEPVTGVAALAVAPSVMVMQYSVVTNGLMFGLQTFYDIWLALVALLNGLLARLGIRARRRYWGVVYDSETKQPLDPAIVELVDARTGQKVESCITNLDGEYGFLDKPGEYYIRVTRSHYVFPSSRVQGSSDGLYESVYHGERVVIEESVDLIAPNIPMDPVEFDWNQSAKQSLVKVHPKLEAFVTNVLEFIFYVGFVFTFLVLLANTNVLNFVFFCIYVVMALLRYLIPSARLYGRLVAARPTEGLLIELSHEKIQTIVIAKTLVKRGGKFFLRIPSGRYVMRVKDVKHDTVETLFTKTIEIGKERVLNKIIRID